VPFTFAVRDFGNRPTSHTLVDQDLETTLETLHSEGLGMSKLPHTIHDQHNLIELVLIFILSIYNYTHPKNTLSHPPSYCPGPNSNFVIASTQA